MAQAPGNSVQILGSAEPLPREKDNKPNIKFWLAQISAAKESTREYFKASSEAYAEYLGTFREGPESVKAPATNALTPDVRYPIYWSSVRTIQPAIYSRTPTITVQKTFDDLSDDVARVATLCLERLGKYLMRCCPFDRVMYSARDTFIHTGKATSRVFFDAYIKETTTKKYVTQIEVPVDQDAQPQVDPATGQPLPPQMQQVWVDADSKPIQGEDGQVAPQVLQDETGFYIESVEESIDSTKSFLHPLSYQDVLHTPNARHQEEIDWIAYKSLMTKEDVAERFGPETADKLHYEQFVTTSDGSERKLILPTAYVVIWEIWDKRAKSVYWYAEAFETEFIDTKPDPYELDGFFPSAPFIFGTLGPDNLYPVPDYIQLRPFINQLHGMASRLKKLVRAARRRGLADASVPELIALANDTDDAEFVMVSAFQQQVVGKGGIENIIKFFPTEEFVAAIAEMVNVIQTYEDKFNELYGIPDILRGVSDPNETAAAQQLKGRFLSLRFSATQREFQRFCRDCIERMCDLALRKFPQDKLEQVCGVSHMDPEDQQVWPQALLILRDDNERKVRIDIETDSTITMNQNADIEQRNYLAKTLFEGLAGVANATSQNPAFASAAGAVLMFVIEGLREGKEIEGRLRPALEQLAQPQEPKPDPEMVKLQGQMALKEKEIQGKAQIETLQAQADIATTNAKTQADIVRENVKAKTKVDTEERLAQLEATLRVFEAKLEASLKTADHIQKTDAEQQRTNRELLKDAFKSSPPGGA